MTESETRSRERSQPSELLLAQDVVGQEDICEPGIRHRLGLAELLAGDPDCAEFDLTAREPRKLVGLDMRAQFEPVGVGVGLRACKIGLDAGEID